MRLERLPTSLFYLSLLINVYSHFLMIFRFLRAVRHANLFFFSSYSSNSRDSSANDVYASGPETSSSPRLFLEKKQTTTKWILCSFLKSPFYCPFPICSLHFIKTPGLREFILYKSFFIWMQSDSRESKKKHPPSLALSRSSIFLLFILLSSSPLSANLFTHIFEMS